MHIYIFFLDICYNNDRKFKYYLRNNHPKIHTNLYILGFFFSFLYQTMFGFFHTAFGPQCIRGILRSSPQQKIFSRDVEKVGLPIQKQHFFCYHQIYKSSMTKKSESLIY